MAIWRALAPMILALSYRVYVSFITLKYALMRG